MIRYKRRAIETKMLSTDFEFATPDGQDDTEVRIPEATLCWISKESIDEFTRDIQAVINRHAI